MLDALTEIFAVYGLEINQKKTEIMSTQPAPENNQVCITKHGSVDILSATPTHKYLGRGFFGECTTRGKAAVNHRLNCAWMEYKMYQHVFEDKHITLVLRFKLFQSIISPTVIYSLDTCPLTVIQKNRIDATQRVMLRRMVGWTSYGDTSWEERGRRMKYRLERSLATYPIEFWPAEY